jgi:hypothetical protein
VSWSIKALACELPARRGLPLAHWSLNELRREAIEHVGLKSVAPMGR